MAKTSDFAPVGSFEEQVMLAVIRTGSDAYGMNVRRELEQVTSRDITIGSVYITLDRLEAKGLVASARTTDHGGSSSRRVFSVTPLGARVLAETKVMRERLWAGVQLPIVLRRA
jgi:PadR family transcriptional regulator, regulatory protein PadR